MKEKRTGGGSGEKKGEEKVNDVEELSREKGKRETKREMAVLQQQPKYFTS